MTASPFVGTCLSTMAHSTRWKGGIVAFGRVSWTLAALLACLVLSACHKQHPCSVAGNCADGNACASSDQCASRVCAGSLCQPPSCADGVQNGNETSIDCGGHCGANCGLGVACRSGADCAFGLCASNACAAPTAGPDPTGAVAATIAPDGGTVVAVSAEHVAVALVFPAGAVVKPLAIKVTPTALQGDEWARMLLEPVGAVFAKPIAVSLALPPGVSAANAVAYFGSAAAPSPVATSVSGTTVTAQIASFGLPSLFGSPLPPGAFGRSPKGQDQTQADLAAPRSPDVFEPGSVLAAANIPIERKIQIARDLFDGLLVNGDPAYAAGVAHAIAALLQQLPDLDPPHSQLVREFIARTESASCAALQQAMGQLKPFIPFCVPELYEYARPVLQWGRILTALDFPVGTCPPFDDDSWKGLVHSKYDEVIRNIEADYRAFVRCDCNATPRDQWTRKQQMICPTVVTQRMRSQLTVDTDRAAQILPDDYVYAEEMVIQTRLLGLPVVADDLGSGLAGPVEAAVRRTEFRICKANTDSSTVGELLQRVPGNAGAQQDAQYCASTLAYAALNADGTAGQGGVLSVAAPDSATDATTSANVIIPSNGTLKLSGPLPALHCPLSSDGTQPAYVEADSLLVKADGQTIAMQPAAATGDLLSPAIQLSIADVFRLAGKDPVASPSLTLEVWRRSPGCGGLYASGDTKLFAVSVTTVPCGLLGHVCPNDPLWTPEPGSCEITYVGEWSISESVTTIAGSALSCPNSRPPNHGALTVTLSGKPGSHRFHQCISYTPIHGWCRGGAPSSGLFDATTGDVISGSSIYEETPRTCPCLKLSGETNGLSTTTFKSIVQGWEQHMYSMDCVNHVGLSCSAGQNCCEQELQLHYRSTR